MGTGFISATISDAIRTLASSLRLFRMSSGNYNVFRSEPDGGNAMRHLHFHQASFCCDLSGERIILVAFFFS